MTPATRSRKPPSGKLGKWIAGMLKSRYWTQADLARKLGVDQSQVSKWVRGARTPDVPHCEAIARAFGVPSYEVLRLADKVPARLREPTMHPVRDRAHAIIDVMDPHVIELFLPLMERYHSLIGEVADG